MPAPAAPVAVELPRAEFERLLAAEDYEGALALAEGLLGRDADSYEARLLAGRAQQKLHRPEAALALFESALQLRADDAELYDFRGSMMQEIGRLPEALADYERALSLRPDFPLARYHLAMARLLAGDFARGWDGYELRRLGAGTVAGTEHLPRWDGAPLAGRTLFIAREQGLGDEIMFASVLPQLIGQAGQCVLECEPRLLALFRRSFPAATVFASPPGGGLPAGASPRPIDCWIEAGSLPRLLRRRPEDFPRHAGYLHADPALVERWRERLAQLGPGLKVGIAWTGGVRMTRRALRSVTLEQLRPLLRVPGARFVSLQYTPDARAAVEALRTHDGIDIAHWPDAIDDYDQTAALVSALDLVVSVCTAVVHLGGALGVPVWVLAPVGPEWRYGFSGDGMPWYPSVRLIRQRAYGEWQPVIATAAAQLEGRAARAGTPATAAAAQVAGRFALEGRYGEAIEALRGAPRDAETANLLGACLTLLNRYDEALSQYDAALTMDPSLADAWANAGWTLRLLGRDTANRYFRQWLLLATAGEPRYPVAAPQQRLALPEVALCCVDSAYHELAARALRASMEGCAFGDALFLSDRDCGAAGVRFVPVEPIRSLQAYSNFMIHGLHAHVRSSHVLVIQYDGFVLHPAAWDPRFLDYDYIGPAVRLPDGSAGGIGGFSLRSRRLLEALRDEPAVRAYDAAREPYAEDIAICCAFRRILEQRHGVRFAPAELADRFAAEASVPTARTFGFHNLMHLVSLQQNGFRPQERPEEGLRVVFRARTAAGPLAAERTIELRARGDAWARFLPGA